MKKIIAIIIALILVTASLAAFADSSEYVDFLTETAYKSPGDTSSDWSAAALAISGAEFDRELYLKKLGEYVKGKYNTPELLSKNKSTEWHRIAIAVAALGKDASDFEGINLIQDGVFNRENLGRQGLNAYIWALIAAGSQNSEEPAGALNTYDSMLSALISRANSDGGFSLSGNRSDPDITAMAVYAMAQFRERADVKTAIDNAINSLSAMQSENGDFISGGYANAESTAQVVTALSALGIDANTDERFIKNSTGAYDALMKYDIGHGFCHVLGENADIMATYQAVIAIKAYESKSAVYRFPIKKAVQKPLKEEPIKEEPLTEKPTREKETSVQEEETIEEVEIVTEKDTFAEESTEIKSEPTTENVNEEEKGKINLWPFAAGFIIIVLIAATAVVFWKRRKRRER